MVVFCSVLVTREPFRVRDRRAFESEVRRYSDMIEVYVDDEGYVWLSGEQVGLVEIDPDTDEELYLGDVIKRHILPGDVAVLRWIGWEGTRFVDAAVLVATCAEWRVVRLVDVEEEVARKIPRSLPRYEVVAGGGRPGGGNG